MSDKSSPPPPDPVWDLLQDLDTEEQLEKAAALPAAELDAKLRAQKIDPARPQELLAKVTGVIGAPASNVTSLDTARQRRALRAAVRLPIAAGFALAVSVETATIVAIHPPDPPPYPTRVVPPPPSPELLAALKHRDDLLEAGELRKAAADACDKHAWDVCQEKLNKAYALDPDGSDDPAMKALAKKANDGLLDEFRHNVAKQ